MVLEAVLRQIDLSFLAQSSGRLARMRILSRAVVSQHSFVRFVHTITAFTGAALGSLQAKCNREQCFRAHWPTEHSNISLASRPQHVSG